ASAASPRGLARHLTHGWSGDVPATENLETVRRGCRCGHGSAGERGFAVARLPCRAGVVDCRGPGLEENQIPEGSGQLPGLPDRHAGALRLPSQRQSPAPLARCRSAGALRLAAAGIVLALSACTTTEHKLPVMAEDLPPRFLAA